MVMLKNLVASMFVGGLVSLSAAASMEAMPEGEMWYQFRPLSHVEPLVITKEPHTFRAGKNYWDQARENFNLHTYRIMTSNHLFHNKDISQGESRKFLELANMLKAVPRLRLNFKGVFQGLNLTLQCDESSSVLYVLLLNYNGTVLEMADLVKTFWQSTYYYRQDLESFKDLLKEVVCFFHRSEDVIKEVYGIQGSTFDREAVVASLEQGLYVPAAKVNKSVSDYVAYIKNNFEGCLSVYEFIVLTSRFYVLGFSNLYTMVQAHLAKNQGAAAPKHFNRKFKKRERTLPSYDLTSCDMSESLESQLMVENLADETEISPPRLKKKHKKRRPRKKRDVHGPVNQETVMAAPVNDEAEMTAVSVTPLPAAPAAEVDPVPLSLQNEETPVPAQLPKIVKTTTRQAKEPRERTSSKLYRLHEILSEYDDGVQAGMKTRHFLRLAAALNKLGYFNSFMANAKLVRINIQPNSVIPTGMVTTMHTNHRGRGQDQGITGPTADKMNEVLAIVKQLSEGPNQEK